MLHNDHLELLMHHNDHLELIDENKIKTLSLKRRRTDEFNQNDPVTLLQRNIFFIFLSNLTVWMFLFKMLPQIIIIQLNYIY